MDSRNCKIFKSKKNSARERQKERNGRLIEKIRREFGFIGDFEERQRIYTEIWVVLKSTIDECQDWSKYY